MKIITTTVFLMLSFSVTKQISPVLQPYQGKNRLVVILTPSDTHPKFKKQLKELKKVSEGLINRDLFIIKNHQGSTIFANEYILTKAENYHLRKYFEIPPKSFSVVLIGKDGTEKLRTKNILTSELLFKTIDQMPMRKAEMKSAKNKKDS